MNFKKRHALLISMTAIMLSACGQKGPLVLPNKPVLKPEAPAVQSPATNTKTSDQK